MVECTSGIQKNYFTNTVVGLVYKGTLKPIASHLDYWLQAKLCHQVTVRKPFVC